MVAKQLLSGMLHTVDSCEILHHLGWLKDVEIQMHFAALKILHAFRSHGGYPRETL